MERKARGMPGILKGRSPNIRACGSVGSMAVIRTILGSAAATTRTFSRLISSSNGTSSGETSGPVSGVNVTCRPASDGVSALPVFVAGGA